MASPALAVLAALASRRSLFFFRARAFLPDMALDAWVVPCASRARVVVRRECVASSSGLPRRKLSILGIVSHINTSPMHGLNPSLPQRKSMYRGYV